MWTLVWFLLGLLTGLAFAYPATALQGLALLAAKGQKGHHRNLANRNKTPSPEPNPTDSHIPSPLQKQKHQEQQQHIITTTDKPLSTATDRTRRLRVVENDPLSASVLSSKPIKLAVPQIRRNIKGGRSSLRSKASRDGSIRRRQRIEKVVAYSTPFPSVQEHPQAETGATSIPIDAESRWRDHHRKRQWAQSVLIESMEPVLSRHLRHAIKAVLHLTSVSPETVDMKLATQGFGHWDSFIPPAAPTPVNIVTPAADLRQAQLSRSSSWNFKAKALSSSATVADEPPKPANALKATSTSLKSISRALEPPLPVDSQINKKESHMASVSSTISQPAAHQGRSRSYSSASPIVIRGFSSTSDESRQDIHNEDEASKVEDLKVNEPRVEEPERFDEVDLGSPAILQISNESQPDTPSETQTGSKVDNSSAGMKYAIQMEMSDGQQSQQPHQSEQESMPRPTRFWSKVRKAVQGEFKQGGIGRNSLYLISGGPVKDAKVMSDTNLPSSRPISASSTSLFNIAMPSFSSSALSLLSEDQMSSHMGPANSPPTLKTSLVFETPPETALNSPVPASPTGSKPAYQHNLPGLARRSSSKSSAAAAEVTTAESSISQFMYCGQQSHTTTLGGHPRVRSTEVSGTGGFVNDLMPQQQRSRGPSEHNKSNIKSSIQFSGNSITSPSRTGVANHQLPLTRSRSASDAPKRVTPLQSIRQEQEPIQERQQGLGQKLSNQQRSQDIAMLPSPKKSPEQQRCSLDLQQERCPPSPTMAKNGSGSGNGRTSTSLSPVQLLSISGAHLNPAKEERRKSAISFGGYFSNPSEAVRRARDQRGHSTAGLGIDETKDEVIHMRRTSFFEKSSPPTLASMTAKLQASLPSMSQSFAESGISLLSRSPSKTQETSSQGQSAHHQSDLPPTGSGAGLVTGVRKGIRGARNNITPLKITPLLHSGVSSFPSPMFPPLSATIPRPLGSISSPALDRYYFGVDQVHEWNIPSYGRVKFTDHAPLVFHAIRERFHYTLADMDEALSQPMAVMKTPGKSNAVFFASHNHGRFLLKTLRGSEPEALKGFLNDYLAHIQKHPNTLLPRYLGMYTFERLAPSKAMNRAAGQSGVFDGGMGSNGGISGDKHGLGANVSSNTAQHLHLNGTLLSGRDDGLPAKVVVVVLANVFDTPNIVNERYDFKGSNVGRETLPTQQDTREKQADSSAGLSRAELGRTSSDMDQNRALPDLARRRSRRADPVLDEKRSSTAHFFDMKRDEQNSSAGKSTLRDEDVDDISHLTLKEMDFQNRIMTGETQLIHLGPLRRSEMLSQLEEDTALLRKHDFMDYSILVGIRIVPKAAVQDEQSDSSHGSDGRRSRYSCGSDADNSNLDSDDDGSSSSKSVTDKKNESTGDLSQVLDQLWNMMHLSEVLSEERVAFIKELSERAQTTLREMYFRGESATATGSRARKLKRKKDTPAAVELKPVRSTGRSKGGHGSRQSLRAMDEFFDPDSFQTVRYKSRADSSGPSARRPALSNVINTSRNDSEVVQGQWDSPAHLQQPQQGQEQQGQQEQQDHQSPSQHQPIWSQGVTSVGLPEDYEVVYYFGLIDILQKYNLSKWLERNFKGANARLLGGGGGGSSSTAAPPRHGVPSASPLIHPNRSSTSLVSSNLYHLLPQATASEPSLPTAFESVTPMNPTLSVLIEDSASSSGSGTGCNTSPNMNQEGGASSLPDEAYVDPGAETASSQTPSTPSLLSRTRLSSSIPFTKSIGARLSTYSQYSHSSQQSHHSRQSGRSRDSRLSLDTRDSNSSESMSIQQQQQQTQQQPPVGLGLLSLPQPDISQQQQQPQKHQAQSSAHYPVQQHAEVSVEEPGRYAERLIEFMRGVIV
ncbi:Phosphatidylinositol 5-phosphate 4-kinase type-2 alpha [Mortierella polycephala]|uniref:Phosphatidylinositol 5-phosphate 4-kinase type-2 alpha n=1 Tax=Mortierella polycephala TaxID=41804 RepID=A0A9P6PNM0_9FUNG|nr:Phosphatidylinositol 5-phosphate 4-kinase type-2 alpha [Mortierella polycephala]